MGTDFAGAVVTFPSEVVTFHPTELTSDPEATTDLSAIQTPHPQIIDGRPSGITFTISEGWRQEVNGCGTQDISDVLWWAWQERYRLIVQWNQAFTDLPATDTATFQAVRRRATQ